MQTIVILKGKTLKGKNRINEQGDQWFLKEVSETFDGKPGPWLFLEHPSTGTNPMAPARLVHKNNDIHFEVKM